MSTCVRRGDLSFRRVPTQTLKPDSARNRQYQLGRLFQGVSSAQGGENQQTYQASSVRAPARNAPHGEDASSERRAQSRLARLKPLDNFAGDLEGHKKRGVGGRHEHRTCPGQGTAGLELASASEGVETTKIRRWRPEGEAERRSVLLLRGDPVEGTRGSGWSPRETPCEGDPTAWRGTGTCKPEGEKLAMKLEA
jgi:hypothetical protein